VGILRPRFKSRAPVDCPTSGYNGATCVLTHDDMCLIFIAHHASSDYPLVIAANRDEYHHRATQVADFWTDAPQILGGRDLEAGGTWLGIHRNGRFAALTNYRESRPANSQAPSRGLLVSDFLHGRETALSHLQQLARTGSRYNGFSLLVHDGETLACYSNREGVPQAITTGIHGLSNRVLDTPWPKVTTGKAELQQQLATGALREEDLFALLGDARPAADRALPDTGIGLERERQLSPRFILGAEYGTRCATLLSVDRQGHARFIERSYDPAGQSLGEVRYDFEIERDTASAR